jgi:hypothetical protein
LKSASRTVPRTVQNLKSAISTVKNAFLFPFFLSKARILTQQKLKEFSVNFVDREPYRFNKLDRFPFLLKKREPYRTQKR